MKMYEQEKRTNVGYHKEKKKKLHEFIIIIMGPDQETDQGRKQ